MLVTLDLVEPTVLADMGLEIRDSDISGSRVNVPSKCKQTANYFFLSTQSFKNILLQKKLPPPPVDSVKEEIGL